MKGPVIAAYLWGIWVTELLCDHARFGPAEHRAGGFRGGDPDVDPFSDQLLADQRDARPR